MQSYFVVVTTVQTSVTWSSHLNNMSRSECTICLSNKMDDLLYPLSLVVLIIIGFVKTLDLFL